MESRKTAKLNLQKWYGYKLSGTKETQLEYGTLGASFAKYSFYIKYDHNNTNCIIQFSFRVNQIDVKLSQNTHFYACK